MTNIKFRLAAKTDVGLVRTNNEDNFQAASDLSNGRMNWVNNEICSLGSKGALIVVADGMGGMNAGEVASELAIETVREYFAPENLTDDILKNRFTIEKYMNEVIVAADARIKSKAKNNPETRGMGTTIVIGWVLDGKLYVSWCGDSRAYIYNPAAGLHQISKDHSYVQSLVDKGTISREDAFDFPDSNIITRCLSDGGSKAKPESLLRPYDLCDNDIIMLCTDGLSGMIRDNEMEDVIRGCENDMDALVDNLIQAACDAEGSDNITICLCQILQGGQQCNPSVFDESERRLNGNQPKSVIRTVIGNTSEGGGSKSKIWIISIVCAIVALAVAGGLYWKFVVKDKKQDAKIENKQQTDSINSVGNNPTDVTDMTDTKVTPEENVQTAPENTAAKPATGKEADKKSIFGKEKNDEDKAGASADKNKGKDSDKDKGKGKKEEQPQPEKEDELTPVGNPPANNKVQQENAQKTTAHTYTVKKGDTYYGIAKRFGITPEALQKANGDITVKPGIKLIIPKK